MVALDQNVPLLTVATRTAVDPLATILNLHRRSPPAEGVGAAINRICQDVMDRVVDGRLPLGGSISRLVNHERQQDILFTYPQDNLADALQLREFAEDKGDCVLHAAIGILLDMVVIGFRIASKKLDQRDETQVRIYDLDDGRADNIRSKIKPLPADGHSLFLTVRR